MKVKRIRTRSIRGINDLVLEFSPNEPTVLIGNNGSGKSSVLNSIAVPLSYFVGLVLSKIQDEKRIDLKSNISKPLRFLLRKRDIKNGCSEAYNEITVVHKEQEVTWSITTKIFSSEEFEISRDFSELIPFVDSLTLQSKNSSTVSFPLLVCYPTNRGVIEIPLEIQEDSSIDETRKALIEQVNDFQESLGVRIDFESFFRWFRLLEDLENEARRDEPEYRDMGLEAVRQAIYSLQPDLSHLRVRRSPLRMTVQKQGQELIINQLSDGEKCLLAMVGDLARRLAIANPGLPDPLQGEGVVLIDEIELHLHPKWQRNIVPALTRTFPNCQFIVTTHSPQVLGEVKGKVYRLKTTADGVVAESLQTYGRDSSRILEDEMEADSRSIEIKEDLQKLFRLIEDGDLEAARDVQRKMAEKIGDDEPEFVKAEILIRRREVLGR